MENQINITIVGAGYVGMSFAAVLIKKNNVTILDNDNSKNKKINNNISTIDDPKIDELLSSNNENIFATNDKDIAYKDAEFIFISVPTNFNENDNSLDTSILEKVIIEARNINKNALIIIKSTIPIGFTKEFSENNSLNNLVHNPEFLREGNELFDTLNPSRVIFGYSKDDVVLEKIKDLENIYFEIIKKSDIAFLHMSSDEAEAVKLHSNTYLAMRVAYFNELDSFCMEKGLNSKNVITGISLDPRIGDYYNNPSFGYGGYCLPKDSKQLLSSYENIPQDLIGSIVASNKIRKKYISDKISDSNIGTIGIYRLISKNKSKNFRESAILDIIYYLIQGGFKLFIYEPDISEKNFENIPVIHDLDEFKKLSDLIVTNRMHTDLNDVKSKVFSRDIYNTDI